MADRQTADGLTARELSLAGLPTVDVGPPFGLVSVLPRWFLEADMTAGQHGCTFACTGCGALRMVHIYDGPSGLLVLWCSNCQHALGAIRVAADA